MSASEYEYRITHCGIDSHGCGGLAKDPASGHTCLKQKWTLQRGRGSCTPFPALLPGTTPVHHASHHALPEVKFQEGKTAWPVALSGVSEEIPF